MNKFLVNAGANEAGAWKVYSDGSSIKFIASLNVTIISDLTNDIEVRVEGRQGV